MNTLLWILQAILAIKFLTVVINHGLVPNAEKMQRGRQRLGRWAKPVLLLVSLGALLGAVGLLFPAFIHSMAWLTPWAAALLAGMSLASAVIHRSCRDTPKTWVSLILFALAAFVAYGRWVLAPL